MVLLGMITISDDVILNIPIHGPDEETINLREYPEIVIHADNSRLPQHSLLVRKTVAEKLQTAQSFLGEYKLMVLEGLRPIELQRQYFEEYYKELQRAHPDWTHETLYTEASKYVAPPEIIPPHSTGAAVDLTLCTAEGKELDMGARVNATPEESHNAVFMDARHISKEARTNRKLLEDAMMQAGFVNYPYEFWHWSYGDRYWAYATQQNTALYGAI